MAERYNAAVAFVDRHLTGRAEKVAFRDPRRALTYGELHDQASRVGPALEALGIAPEHRVVMLMLDTVDFPVVFWGAIRAGIIPVPLNTLLGPDQYAYVLEDSRAPLVLVSAPLLPAVEAAIAASGRPVKVVVAGAEPGTKHSRLDDLLTAAAPAAEPAATCADEVAFWLYSSGSTGMPKGVKHVHSSLIETARLYGEGVLGIAEDDVVYSAAKLFFAYGLGNAMTFPMAVGATAALLDERPTPKSVFSVMKREQPTIFFGVPTLYAAMLNDPDCTPENGSRRLRLCVSAGEALPEHVGLAWRKKFGVEILDGTGSTELLHIYLTNAPGDLRYGTSGRAVPATSCASSTRPAARSASARSARCWCADPRMPRATGTSARSRAAPSRAPGRAPATSTSARPTDASSAAAAPTTCSRFQASGSRPSRSRRR